MPRVSKKRLRKQDLQELDSYFSFLIASLQKSSEIENFLDNFLTVEEKLMLSKRLMLYMMIAQEYPFSVIQEVLHVSYETVRSYSKQAVRKNKQFQATIRRLIKREESLVFWKKVDRILKPLELAFQAKGNMRARAKLISADYD